MPKQSSKRTTARKATKNKSRKPATPRAKERDAFVESLIQHGQAAKPRADGTLPPGATHEIVEGEDGEVKVVRRRFSLL